MKTTSKLYLALQRVIKSEYIEVWLNTPNKAFDNQTPAELIEHGEEHQLWQMIYELESGQAG